MHNNCITGIDQMRSDATLEEKLLDILGAYTILTNGTIYAKNLAYPESFNIEHKQEIVRRFLACIHASAGGEERLKEDLK